VAEDGKKLRWGEIDSKFVIYKLNGPVRQAVFFFFYYNPTVADLL
jgi:hypothetical protein